MALPGESAVWVKPGFHWGKMWHTTLLKRLSAIPLTQQEATCGMPRRCMQQVSKCWRWAFNIPQDLVRCLVFNAFPLVTDKHSCCMQQNAVVAGENSRFSLRAIWKKPILWDIRLKEYKNNKAKLDALTSLATVYETDVASIKNKIKNLRVLRLEENATFVCVLHTI